MGGHLACTVTYSVTVVVDATEEVVVGAGVVTADTISKGHLRMPSPPRQRALVKVVRVVRAVMARSVGSCIVSF